MTDKAALRKALITARKQAALRNPLAGLTLSARVPASVLPAKGEVVAGYWPIRGEIDPRPLMQRCARLGLRLALPVTAPRGEAYPMVFRAWDAKAPLSPGSFGVPEPDPSAPILVPDLVLVPLVGVDATGNRLGYGAGQYDRTLASLRMQKPVLALGLAWSVQETEALPAEAHDQPLDALVTERAFRIFSGPR